jgi:hypothetical protein
MEVADANVHTDAYARSTAPRHRRRAEGYSNGINNKGEGLTDCADPDRANIRPSALAVPLLAPSMVVVLIVTLGAVGLPSLRGTHRRACRRGLPDLCGLRTPPIHPTRQFWKRLFDMAETPP